MMFSLEWTLKSCANRLSYSLGPAFDDSGALISYLVAFAASTSAHVSFRMRVVAPLTFSRYPGTRFAFGLLGCSA